ncbi:hypothetical protein [Burkholderia vietnamiensis]|uniref:hypothetical protein n=1 Tax=Burkholderia vietnamiensis TaxID=60552 RepID=UPI001B907ED1|nr:hypothetical protein [Burkholderia vietnamiensis]MBR8000378.1 hypothetical protein [Burkholderia vietnamiensis]MCA8451680.1 hypothetical protein [Burkholderia vietnamiensis]HDR8956090.1 hypothetical protein [Burkholderia vietnamiensis]
MPRIKRYLPDEYVLFRLEDLSEEILLVPEQVSMLTGRGLEKLKADREADNPPPYVQHEEGSPHYYRVGDVRDYLRSLKSFRNNAERVRYFKEHAVNGADELAPLTVERRERFDSETSALATELRRDLEARRSKASREFLGFESFDDYLTSALPDDEWPFTIAGGKPIEFFASLGLGGDHLPGEGVECRWLSLDEYLAMRRDAALQERQEREAAELRAAADEASTEPLPAYERPVMGGRPGGRL